MHINTCELKLKRAFILIIQVLINRNWEKPHNFHELNQYFSLFQIMTVVYTAANKSLCITIYNIFKVFHGNETAFLCQPHFIMDCKLL
jgi:hypothetical protein